MSYIGNTNTTQGFTPAIDYFSGDGSTVAFTLSRPVASVAQVQATISNVPQNPSSAFSVSGNTITFTSAPLSGTNNIYVYYTSPITQVIAPGQGTVTSESFGQIVNFTTTGNTVLGDASTDTLNVGNGGLVKDASGNVGIGTNSPGVKLDTKGLVRSSIGTGTGAGGAAYAFYQFGTSATATENWHIGTEGDGSFRFYNQGFGAGLERMRIDSSGNVGVGVAPTQKLDVAGASKSYSRIFNGGNTNTAASDTWWYIGTVELVDSSPATFRIDGTTGYGAGEASAGCTYLHVRKDNASGLIGYFYGTTFANSGVIAIAYKSTGVAYRFDLWIRIGPYASTCVYCDTAGAYTPAATSTGSTAQPSGSTLFTSVWTATTSGIERMRIDSSGNLLVGASGTANGKVHINGSVVYTVPATFSASIGANAAWTTGYGSQAINLSLWASSGIGGVSVYNVSDRRLKEQITQLTGTQALSFIEKTKPVQFVWKEEQTTDTGFIAQDILAAGFGHLVSMIPDNAVQEEIDENGNVSPAGSRFVMKYDSVIPILTAAIKEQQAIIQAQAADIAALKEKVGL